MDNFDISHSEKDFLGGGWRGREAGGALLGDLIMILHYQLVTKATLKIVIAMPLGSLKTRFIAVLLAILVYP